MRRHQSIAAASIIAAALAACSSGAERALDASASASPSVGSNVSQLLPGPSTQASAAAEAWPTDFECPIMDVRQGAATLSITSAASADPSQAMLRYQGNLTQLARECSLRGNELAIRAGAQGRIILGPAGTPGQLEIPLRYALVREGPEPKTIWTKLYKIPVSIAEGQGNATFTHVDEISVPRPSKQDLDNYVVYVGFDAAAAIERPKKAPPAKRKR
jgi:hypothetical protein